MPSGAFVPCIEHPREATASDVDARTSRITGRWSTGQLKLEWLTGAWSGDRWLVAANGGGNSSMLLSSGPFGVHGRPGQSRIEPVPRGDDPQRGGPDRPCCQQTAEQPHPITLGIIRSGVARRGASRHTLAVPIEIPSVKRHSVSSPALVFLCVPDVPFSCPCDPRGAAQPSVRALGWDPMVPAQLGGYEGADGANYPTTSMSCVLRQGNSRARRSRFSQLDSRRILRRLRRADRCGVRSRAELLRIVRHPIPPHRVQDPGGLR